VRDFAGEAVLRMEDPNRADILAADAERIERIFLGRDPAYVTTNWWRPDGVGAHVATRLGWGDETEHAVAGLLLRLALAIYGLNPEGDWKGEFDAALQDTLDGLTGGAAGLLGHVGRVHRA